MLCNGTRLIRQLWSLGYLAICELQLEESTHPPREACYNWWSKLVAQSKDLCLLSVTRLPGDTV